MSDFLTERIETLPGWAVYSFAHVNTQENWYWLKEQNINPKPVFRTKVNVHLHHVDYNTVEIGRGLRHWQSSSIRTENN